MSRSLTPYGRKAIASFGVVCVAALTVVVGLGSSAAKSFMDTRQALAQTLALVERTGEPLDAASLDAVTLRGAKSDRFVKPDLLANRIFHGSDPADIQSQFQTMVKAAASRRGFTVDSLQVLKTERVGGLTKVSLRLDGALPESSLGAFLVDLATGEPVIVLQGLDMRPQAVQGNRLTTAGQGAKTILARVDLAAFSGAAASAPGKSMADRRGSLP